MELVPVVEGAPIGRVELLRGPDVQSISDGVAAYLVGVGLHHQIVTHDDGVVSIAIRCVAPHLYPPILRSLVLPHRIVEIASIEPIARLIPEEGELTATRPGTKGDHGEHVGRVNHVQQAIQVALNILVQDIRWVFGE